MADAKISQLTDATTPLTGTEVLPIVQSGVTKKVSVSNLTATRPISASKIALQALSNVAAIEIVQDNTANFGYGIQADSSTGRFSLKRISGGVDIGSILNIASDGNIVPVAAKGVNFTANTPAAGMTSQLLNWYEEGTFTPTLLSGGAQVGRTYSVQFGRYTRIGNRVMFNIYITLSAKGTSTGVTQIGGMPFTSASDGEGAASVTIGNVTYSGQIGTFIAAANTLINIYDMTSGNPLTLLPDTGLANDSLFLLSGQYKV